MNVRPRRRRRATLAVRVRRLWVLVIFLVLIVGAGAYALVTAQAFRPDQIDVTGTNVVPKDEVLAHAAVDRDTNVWLLNAGAIEKRVRAIPLVATARVVRGLPNRVAVDITERTPSGCVESPAGRATIDDERRVLSSGCRDELPRFVTRARDLPTPGIFLADQRLGSLQRDADALERAGLHVARLRDDAFGGLDATLRDGLVLEFGADDDLDTKLRLVGPVLDAVKAQRPHIAALDLRAPGTPVIRYR